jgi:hypothetical protein
LRAPVLSLSLFASAAKEYFDLRAIFIQFKAAGVGVIKENKIAPLWPCRDRSLALSTMEIGSFRNCVLACEVAVDLNKAGE